MSPRTEKQFELIREERRQKIMDSALDLFAKNGYDNTSISQIASKADISKGLLYNYFKSKEDLLEAILNTGIDELMDVFDPNKDGVLEVSEMKFFLEEMFKILKKHRVFWRLYFSVTTQPSVFKLVEKRIEEIYKPLTKMTVDYFTRQGHENPTAEAILFGALLDGISFDYVLKPDIFPIEMVKKELINRYCC
ncbi:MAG: TetR/AcrR family transcriptional regulator [Bacteroidales bacterium]|nr:TetR/AcrR family transcriptional regulator [Bacteroidales bacterium]